MRAELLRLMDHVERLVPTDRDLAGAARRRSRPRPARASSAGSRTRSTRWCAPTSRSSRTGGRTGTTTYGDFERRLHRHADPARRPHRDPARGRGVRRCASPSLERHRRSEYVALVTSILDEAGINYLSVDRAGQERRVVRGQGGAHRRRAARVHRPAARDHRPGRRPRHHLRARRRRRRRRRARRSQLTVLDDRDLGQETASEGRFGYASRHLQVAARRRPGRPGAGAHRAAARVGRVRARHPLQGHGPGRARPGLRPPVHPRRRAAGAGRPGVHHDPRAAARRRGRRAGRRRPRGSPARARGLPRRQYPDAEWSRTDHYAWIAGLLPELGITSLAELGEVLAGSTTRRSPRGWTTATRPAPYAASTTRCSRRSASSTSTSPATPTAGPCCAPAWSGSG